MKSILEREFSQLFAFLAEDKISIYYSPSTRSFSIGSKDGAYTQEILFCPWTGRKLPESLAEEFDRILEKRGLSFFDTEAWPASLRGEEWWIELDQAGPDNV